MDIYKLEPDLLADHNASLLYAISYMLLLWLIVYWMDKKRVYVKV